MPASTLRRASRQSGSHRRPQQRSGRRTVSPTGLQWNSGRSGSSGVRKCRTGQDPSADVLKVEIRRLPQGAGVAPRHPPRLRGTDQAVVGGVVEGMVTLVSDLNSPVEVL